MIHLLTHKLRSPKLRIVIRDDLRQGQKLAQVAHIVATFAFKRPLWFIYWLLTSNYIIVLKVKNEEILNNLSFKAKCVKFREPDLNNSLTSITFIPSNKDDNLTKNLKLA